jgi:hypothetical protein
VLLHRSSAISYPHHLFGSCVPVHSFLHTAQRASRQSHGSRVPAYSGRHGSRQSRVGHVTITGPKSLVESVRYSPRLASSRFVAHPFICSSCLPPSKTRQKISRQETSLSPCRVHSSSASSNYQSPCPRHFIATFKPRSLPCKVRFCLRLFTL